MIASHDPLNWYYDQLAGLEPETTPGQPFSGYYLLRRRLKRPNDDPKRRPGDSRNKVRTVFLPIHIYYDNGWRMVVNNEVSEEHHRDPDYIETAFSLSCRQAITKQEYEDRINENQRVN